MLARPLLVVTAMLSGAVVLGACGTTPAEDRDRITFPARQDFPVDARSVDTLPAGARTYALASDLETSHLFVQLFSASLGHDHVVRATQWEGSLQIDPANLAGCAISVTVAVEGLDPERDEMRDLIGQDRVSTSDRDGIREHLRGEDQLNLAKYDTLRFTSKSCELLSERGAAGASQVRVLGEMTVRGVAREVSLPLEVALDEERVAARGVLTARHQDFGFEPYSMLGGLFKNKDELYFVLDVRGNRVSGR